MQDRALPLPAPAPSASPAPPASGITADALLLELRSSRTDLGRLVEAVWRDHFTQLVVPQRSVEAWERREPETWRKVSSWLAERGVPIYRI
jgi:hypothetical protein